MSKDAIAIDNLSYAYPSNWSWRKTLALRPFSLDVAVGEAFGFLGHNGAGKTTAIKCLLDLVRPTGGSIKLFGIESRNPASRCNVGYLPEQPYFYDNLSVLEILRLYGRLNGLSGSTLSQRVSFCLDRVGMGARARSSMRSLSKGLTQRVALAQALLGDPRLLILDEPLSGLDPLGRREFCDIFLELKKKGTTLFISSHILSDVEHLCDRCSILVKGELRGVFTIKDIPSLGDARYEIVVQASAEVTEKLCSLGGKAEKLQDQMRIEFNSRPQAEAALACALSQGARIDSYQFVQGSLEDLFVRLTQSGGKEVSRG